jgi:hypothetical protein
MTVDLTSGDFIRLAASLFPKELGPNCEGSTQSSGTMPQYTSFAAAQTNRHWDATVIQTLTKTVDPMLGFWAGCD